MAEMTESSEKTRSSSTIWTMTLAKEAAFARAEISSSSPPHRPLVDLDHALADEEEPATEEYEISPAHGIDMMVLDPAIGNPPDRRPVEERHVQAHHPLDPEKQEYASSERETEANEASSPLLLLRQRTDEDREEDDVVNPEHDLHQSERDERDDPGHWIETTRS